MLVIVVAADDNDDDEEAARTEKALFVIFHCLFAKEKRSTRKSVVTSGSRYERAWRRKRVAIFFVFCIIILFVYIFYVYVEMIFKLSFRGKKKNKIIKGTTFFFLMKID